MNDGVIFEDQENVVGNIAIVPGAPTGILALLIKKNIAKDAAGAEKLLLIVAVVSVVMAAGIFILSSPRHVPPPTPITPGYPRSISQ